MLIYILIIIDLIYAHTIASQDASEPARHIHGTASLARPAGERKIRGRSVVETFRSPADAGKSGISNITPVDTGWVALGVAGGAWAHAGSIE